MNASARPLDLADIQGNIVRPYGRFGFPLTRHLFFSIADQKSGRVFIEALRHQVTTAERWAGIDAPDNAPARPEVAMNIGLSWRGLVALGLPTRTLANMPEEFIDGMAARWSILGDFDLSATGLWDPLWQAPEKIHVWVSLNAQYQPDGTRVPLLGRRTAWLQSLAADGTGITLLPGHRGDSPLWQDSEALKDPATGQLCAKEHFGFTDGIGDPTFEGQYNPATEAEYVIGGGKRGPGTPLWSPLAAGEFILGHPGEAQELPPAAPPWSFTRNGTFAVYRKLHQKIASFNAYITGQVPAFSAVSATPPEAAAATLKAKMVGRWPSGIPLAAAPDYAAEEKLRAAWPDIPALNAKPSITLTPAEARRLTEYNIMLTGFRYGADPDGAVCPLTAHIRRVNPRDALDPLPASKKHIPDSALTNRRRILRRGAPYGKTTDDDTGEHGVIFMAICTSLFRQFEFIQQQWVHYGASFNAGNDTDPLVGLKRPGAKFVIPAASGGAAPPFICASIPQFITTRGGEYFFLPSLTALRQIAQGTVDPT